MSKPSQKKFAKKKKRRKETEKELSARRVQIRKEAKEDRYREKLERDTEPKLVPFRKDPEKLEPRPQTQEEILAQIEHNMKILEALEEDYKESVMQREAANEALEEEGFKTIEEKMNFLNEQASKDAQEAYEKRIQDAEKKLDRRLDVLKKEEKEEELIPVLKQKSD